MTWDYSGDPASSDKDTVRFLIQDTDQTDQLVQDEEIEFAIDVWKDVQGSLYYVAAVMADTIAGRYAREASFSADGVSVGLGQVASQFRELAVSLRAQHNSLLVGGSPDVGGISPYEGLYPGIRNFAFGTGMHDDLEAGPQDYGSRDDVYFIQENSPGQ